MSRYDIDRETMEAIYQKNMNDIGNAYVKARDELMELRHSQEQILRFFHYDPAQKAWVARIEDGEVGILNLLGFLRPCPKPAPSASAPVEVTDVDAERFIQAIGGVGNEKFLQITRKDVMTGLRALTAALKRKES